jgi:hypothetical protein
MRPVTHMRLADILQAAPLRRPGYLPAAMSAGRVFIKGGEEWIEFPDEALQTLRSQFGTPGEGAGGGCMGCGG